MYDIMETQDIRKHLLNDQVKLSIDYSKVSIQASLCIDYITKLLADKRAQVIDPLFVSKMKVQIDNLTNRFLIII